MNEKTNTLPPKSLVEIILSDYLFTVEQKQFASTVAGKPVTAKQWKALDDIVRRVYSDSGQVFEDDYAAWHDGWPGDYGDS